MKCPKCDTTNSEKAEYCKECGETLKPKLENCLIGDGKSILGHYLRDMGDVHLSDDGLTLIKKDNISGKTKKLFILYKNINKLILTSDKKITIDTNSNQYIIEKHSDKEDIKPFYEDIKLRIKVIRCDCGADNPENARFCQKCGAPLRYEKEIMADNAEKGWVTGDSRFKLENEKEEWAKKVSIWLGIWGFLNLFFASPIFGGILIFFAILIYASQNFKFVYIFGIIWLMLALIQLILGSFYIKSYYNNLIEQGYILIILALLNFSFGGYVIYKTRILEEESQNQI